MRKLSLSVAASVLAVAALAAQQLGAAGSSADDDKGEEQRQPGGGPPPWAHSVVKAKHDKSGLESWKKLSPTQREALMTRLAGEHREGMKAYQACRSDGRTDCEKPLPPGLAKRG
jgi:hypothetical protein